MENLGKLGKDKITNFEGIIVGKCFYLFGCAQYALASQTFDKEKGERGKTEWFDEGRIAIIGDGIEAKEVSVEKNGAEFNSDSPSISTA